VTDNSFTLPAFAKINLMLRVLGRRADSFHEILTVFQTITLHDHLTFTALAVERLELICDAPGIPTDERNLALRAGLALREHFGVRRGARIELRKRIPAGGGLGGGSSDAAIALLGLTRLWQIKTDKSTLAHIGARLGADVPFFLTGGTALGTGTGIEITPLDDVTLKNLLILTPGVALSTAEGYKALNAPALTKIESPVNLFVSRAGAETPEMLGDSLFRNDFEPVVFRLRPEIERARDALLREGARPCVLSGSGSSVFGIFDSSEKRARAARVLKDEAGWQVFSCRSLSRVEYRQALGACAALS